MRIVWSGILVVLMLASGVMSSGFVRAQAAPADYLPSSLSLPHEGCFRIEGDGVLDFAGMVARFPGVPEAATVLSDLGWQAGVYRQFACDTPPTGSVGWIDISVHQFATEMGAQAATTLFAKAKLVGTSLQIVPGTTDVTGPASNGTEYTRYVTYGNILFRVTGVAPSGSPQHDVGQLANMQIVLAAVIAVREHRPDVPPASQPVTYPYTITDLHFGSGNMSNSGFINNQSQVVVTSGTSNQPLDLRGRAMDISLVLLSPETTIDLSQLGIDFVSSLTDTGVLLGWTFPEREYVLYVTATGKVQSLPQLENLFLTDTNSTGVTIGHTFDQAVIISDEQTRFIETPSGFDELQLSVINDRGMVAGTAHNGISWADQRAVLIENDVLTVLGPVSGAGAKGSVATDLSNSGYLVVEPERGGAAGMTMGGRGFIYDSATRVRADLALPGYLNSVPTAVNEYGQVVGYAWSPIDSTQPFWSGFLYDYRSGTITNLDSLIEPGSGWHLIAGTDINDAGQIVGRGHINGETHAFLLTPNP